jgi:hypothetical protein
MAVNRLIILTGILAIVALGISVYNMWRSSGHQKEKHLAVMTLERMQRDTGHFGDHAVAFSYIGEGEYRLDCAGLEDVASAGQFAYNAMVALDISNIEQKTDLDKFTIYGYQDGELIFEVYYTFGIRPRVTFHGRFEGVEYEPDFNGASVDPDMNRVTVSAENA